MNKWIVRKPKPTDLSFIYATWLNSYHYDSWTKQTRKSIYFNNYKLVLDDILLTASVQIACLPNDEDIILGYIVHEDNLLHYVYVKDDFRRFGIAKSLVNEHLNLDDEITITHRTKFVLDIIRDNDKFNFNPFKLFKGV